MTNARQKILEAAKSVAIEGKAFISQTWAAYCLATGSRMNLDTFKAQCVENRLDLNLARCDMVQCYSTRLVEASEARYLSATFHFIKTGR